MNDQEEQQEIIDLFAPALGEVPRAAATQEAMRKRLLARVAASTTAHAGQTVVRRGHGEWRPLKQGVRAKQLIESDGGSSVLLALEAGAALPPHRHRFLEEGIVLEGSMQMGELDLGPGDYHVSMPGSRHASITSRDGCLTYLRGSSLGDMVGLVVELLGGLLPGAGEAPVTITTRCGAWHVIADGVEEKRLWHDDTRASRFLRLAPGASLRDVHYPRDSELLVVSGEVFCGDILLLASEFMLAPAGSHHAELSSDVGAVVFVHGGRAA